MSRPRYLLAVLLLGAAVLSLSRARAAITIPPPSGPAPAASGAPVLPGPPSPPAPTPTPGFSLDFSKITLPVPNVAGVWEVAHEADSGQTTYTHFRLQQNGPSLTGDWLDVNGKPYPASGKLDGNSMQLTIQGPAGTISVQARVDPPADMVGIFVEPNGKRSIFTANDQAKYTPAPERSGYNPVIPPH